MKHHAVFHKSFTIAGECEKTDIEVNLYETVKIATA